MKFYLGVLMNKNLDSTSNHHRGGKRENAGRKLIHEGGRQTLSISLSFSQKEALYNEAKKESLTVSQYIIKKCLPDN